MSLRGTAARVTLFRLWLTWVALPGNSDSGDSRLSLSAASAAAMHQAPPRHPWPSPGDLHKGVKGGSARSACQWRSGPRGGTGGGARWTGPAGIAPAVGPQWPRTQWPSTLVARRAQQEQPPPLLQRGPCPLSTCGGRAALRMGMPCNAMHGVQWAGVYLRQACRRDSDGAVAPSRRRGLPGRAGPAGPARAPTDARPSRRESNLSRSKVPRCSEYPHCPCLPASIEISINLAA